MRAKTGNVNTGKEKYRPGHLAGSAEERAALPLRVVSSSPTLGVEIA